MHFSDMLDIAITAKKAPVCAGYDPRPESMPESLLKEAGSSREAIRIFGRLLIDQIHPYVPVIKFQFAFFLREGVDGLSTLVDLMQYAKQSGLIVVLDAKANDIGSTSEAYADAFLSHDAQIGRFVDALTVNPYLGVDSLEPFVTKADEEEKGLFVLVKTSNPGAKDLQDVMVDKEKLYFRTGDMVHRLGTKNTGKNNLSNIGAVVGATYPEAAEELRVRMPEAWFLVPGFGAQGGTIDDIKPCFLPNGKGALIVSARNINYAYLLPQYEHLPYQDAIKQAAIDMTKTIRNMLEEM